MGLLWITDNNHIYKGLSDTYLQGRKKPSATDPDLFPTRIIKSTTPKAWNISTNYNKEPFSDAVSKTNEELQTLGFLVIKNDSILFEKYLNGHSQNRLSNSFSMAKTVLSIITGCAIKEGKISLTTPVYKYLPEYFQAKDSALQVVHLLNMTSGMNFDESYGNPFGFMAKAYYGKDLRELLKGYHLQSKPGEQWEYLGGNNLLLSLLLEKVLEKKVSAYAQEKVWSTCGMEHDAKWILDKDNGHEKTFSGLYSTGRDFAKVGQLYMHQGNINGTQILDSSFVNSSTSPVNVPNEDGELTTNYGYAWWMIKHNNLDVFYMQGILGQYILCIPEKNTIIVRVGEKRMKKSNGKNPDDLFIYLKEGLRIASSKI